MIGYRKKSFGAAHLLLSKLRQDLNNLDAIVELQRLLINEIVRAADNIRSHNQELH